MALNAEVQLSDPVSAGRQVAAPRRRGGLFRKYVVLFACLVGGILVASGAIEGYFSFQDHRAHVVAIQQEKASTAAAKIEAFIGEVEHLLTAMARVPHLTETVSAEERQGDYLVLLRQSPAILEMT